MVYRPPWLKIARTPMGTHCRRNPSAPGLFCRDYQREQCLSIKDHFGFIHGERKWLKQICVACWTRLRQQESHRKISSDCPLKALAAKDSRTGDAKKLDCFSPPSLHTEPKLGACTFWMLVVVLDNLLATFYCKTFLLRDISILDWQCFRAPVQVFLLKTTGLLSFHNRNIQFLIMQHVLPRVPLPTLIVLSFLLDSLITQGEQNYLY